MIIRLRVFLAIALQFCATSIIAFILPQRLPYQSQLRSSRSISSSALRKVITNGHDVAPNRKKSNLLILRCQRKKSEKDKLNYDIQLTALKRYKELYGDLLVPGRFEVPDNSDLWPSETWNLKLGNVVANVRAKRIHKEKVEELESIGFQYNPVNISTKKGFRRARDALVRYKELNGDMLVQYKFVVPCSPDWPAEMWGMKLGSVTNNVRRGSSYFNKRSELEALGFDFTTQHKYGYDLVREGLVRYKELHGHVNVPSRFSIPTDHPDWRSELGGMNLGIVVHDIRRGTYAERKEDLLSLGFKYVLRKKFDYECVRIAVYKYRELNHGLTKIASNYKIHENDQWYPEETWGLCLGGYAKRIREGALWPEKSKELFG